MTSVPARTAAAFVLNAHGRLLLIRENYGHRRFGPPGGLVESGETPWEAVVREVREETSLAIEVQHLIGTYFFPTVNHPFLAFAFRCEILRGEPTVPSTGEIAALGWFEPSVLPLPLTYLAPHAIPDLIAGRSGVTRTIRFP